MGKKRIPLITKWKPTKKTEVFVAEEKLMRCNFGLLIDDPDGNLKPYEEFFIEKVSIQNQLDLIVHYLNYFVNYYDDDKEFIVALLHFKVMLDVDKRFNMDNMKDFIAYIHANLITPSIVEKITAMTEHNYAYDIEASADSAKSSFRRGANRHLESLEFTNQHAKFLLSISVGMKMIAPVMAHYFAINLFKVTKENSPIYEFFRPLFDVFKTVEMTTEEARLAIDGQSFYVYNEKAENYDLYDEDGNLVTSCLTDIDELVKKDADGSPIVCSRRYYAEYDSYAKLYAYVKAKVAECMAANTTIFKQREIFGNDHFTVTRDFLRRVVVSDNIMKYDYGKNSIGFNKTIVRQQLDYYLREVYSRNLTEITNQSSNDGLSGGDKMLINLEKRDEGNGIMADLNAELTVKKIIARSGVDVTSDEIDFYIQHHKPHILQKQLIYNYFAKYFGCVRDCYLLKDRQYMSLLIVLKKKLIADLGYDVSAAPMRPEEIQEKIDALKASGVEYDEEYISEHVRPAALVYILSGNLTDRVNNRLIRNRAFVAKLEDSYTYRDLMENKYQYLSVLQPDYIKRLISSLINSRFTYVEYDHPELLDVPIQYSDDKIANEFLYFLRQI